MEPDPLIGEILDSRYEIAARIGKGSMGVVYRARQRAVDRDVAIKVLDTGSAQGPMAQDAPARFEREARIVSRLRHPNTVKLFDFGQCPDGRLYLVMELLHGEPLSLVLEQGPLDVDRVTSLLVQVCSALAEAHSQGVVHRDVKPSNIVLEEMGEQVIFKILDFGIAKATGDSRATATGAVVGTPAYMSPEQARGEKIDERTDIYSLGVVAYQALTGQPPFEAETPVGVLVKHVNDPPPPFDELDPPVQVPTELKRLVFRMLAKDPGQRPSAAEIARGDLDALGQEVPDTQPVEPATPRPARRKRWLQILGGLVVLLAVLYWIASAPKDEPGKVEADTPPHETPGKVTASLHQLTDTPAFERHVTISADGKFIAYVTDETGNADIYLRRVDGQRAINLTGDCKQDDLFPAFSPDGSQIAFVSLRDGPPGLYLMGATGESVRRVAEQAFNPAWTPDGKAIVFGTVAVERAESRGGHSELVLLNVDTGERRTVFSGDAVQPSVSPNGKRVAYWSSEDGGNRYLWTIGMQGQDPKPVTHDQTMVDSPAWAPDGTRLFFLSNRNGVKNLWVAPIDEDSGDLTGPIEPVTAGTTTMLGLAISRSGQAVTSLWTETSRVVRQAFDPDNETLLGRPQTIATSNRGFDSLDASPDGKWLVFVAGPREDVVIMSSDGTGRRDLTDSSSRDRAPRFSPDGSWIIFYSIRSGRYQAWVVRPDGTGLRQVTDMDAVVYPTWMPDGSGVLIWDNTRMNLALFDPFGDSPAQTGVELGGDWNPKGPVFLEEVSPDGTLLLARELPTTSVGVDSSLVVLDLVKKTLRTVGGYARSARWLPDSRRIVYSDLKTGDLVLRDTATDRKKTIFEAPRQGGEMGLDFALTRAGREFYRIEVSNASDLWLLKLGER